MNEVNFEKKIPPGMLECYAFELIPSKTHNSLIYKSHLFVFNKFDLR